MIDGNLVDVSLPGLLQFLANEIDKVYKITIRSKGHDGVIFVSCGTVFSATFGLLHGEDALCELLSWAEGTFYVERIWDKPEIEQNINLRMEHSSVFVSQCAYLAEKKVGLNTVIITSKTFGNTDWQDEVRKCPLEPSDFSVASWLGGGRTMRQAMREYSVNLVEATGILHRLVKTKSVDKVLPGTKETLTPENIKIKEAETVTAGVDGALQPPTGDELTLFSKKSAATLPIANDYDIDGEAEREFGFRTDSMPLVSIDIERLLGTTFGVTDFGRLSLKNTSLDQGRRQTLEDVGKGKTITEMLNEAKRPGPAILFNLRYCLDRGYIETGDPVISLTVDLLLRQLEIDQYLLQRRRITGDQLRDLLQISREEGVKLPELLVRGGFLTVADIETINKEQGRFAPR